jgi:hypothetical protein
MEGADQVEAFVLYLVDRSEPLVPERVSRELVEIARGAIVVELSARFEKS